MFIVLFFLIFNVYLFLRDRDRERERESRGGADREGDKESEAGSRLQTVSTEPDMGLETTNREIMTQAKIKSQMFTHWATQEPQNFQGLNTPTIVNFKLQHDTIVYKVGKGCTPLYGVFHHKIG